MVGRLDTPGGALLRTSIQEALKEGSALIAINLSECKEIHREMVGTLHSLAKACRRAGGGLVICGAVGDVGEYLKAFGDRSLAPWFDSERDAVLALGGKVEPESSDDESGEPPVVVALGVSDVFKKLFWKLGALGGRPVAKFDSTESAHEFLRKRTIHSLIADADLNPHETARFIKQIRTTPDVRGIGIFLVGPPSKRNVGRALMEEGADNFVPFVFSGEEIVSKLDARAFFSRLKEAYDHFEASRG